ncbi:hypothetical protein H0H93_010545 [Arthromyces matolae]|nr:hypothetical protein H0H93_010545 [Arthromyces matolae]
MKAAPSLFLSYLLVVSASHAVNAYNHPRQLGLGSASTTPTPSTTTSTTTTSTSTTPTTTTSSSSDTSTATTSTTTTPDTSTTTPPSTTSTPPPATTTSPTTTLAPITTSSVSTDADGSTTVVIVTNFPSTTSSDTATASATKAADDDGGSSGLSTGSIIGISVAGGVALIALIGFLVWKFTRKRFNDFDDNEAIKWPELNTHGENVDSHPLPVHNTGRAGFDTGSEASLSRVPSASNYTMSDVSGGPDPYAVPPLPHMNPNQPYRDDPTASTGYYDPYRGPVPGTIDGHGADEWNNNEAIPMTQLAGRSSPGPQLSYNPYETGRQSPAPYGGARTTSPGPHAAYGGATSPAPPTYGGRASPGPHAAYNAGRASPGPQAAYDPYGAR